MRSARLDHPRAAADRPLVLVESATPAPGPGELRIAVSACGVCRTDLQICEGDLAAQRLPIVPGHQIVGRVDAIGDGVLDWRIGDRAGIGWIAGTCGTCAFCRSGRENLCVAAEMTGWHRDGGFATHALVRASFALPLPPDFADVAVAPLLCGGVIGYRALKVSGVRPGERLGLYGFGASARLAMQIARAWGCRVFVCTRDEADRERARAAGAEWVGDALEPPPERLDAAVTFAPVGSVVVAALEATERGGTVAINAIHLDQIPRFSYDALWWERSLRSVANYTRDDARELLRLAAELPLRVEREVLPLDEANAALVKVAAGRVEGCAVLRMER